MELLYRAKDGNIMDEKALQDERGVRTSGVVSQLKNKQPLESLGTTNQRTQDVLKHQNVLLDHSLSNHLFIKLPEL